MMSLFLHKLKPATLTIDLINGETHMSTWKPRDNERILILAPHPDDECLAAGGVIAFMQQYQPESEIRVAIATNGDAAYTTALFHGSHVLSKQHFRSIAVQRQQESLTALTILGLSESQVSFWGFPDRGLLRLRRQYWGSREAYLSPTTGFYKAEQAINSPSLQYNGRNLLWLIQNELASFKPTAIIFPYLWDAHPDHETLALLSLLAAGIQYRQQAFPKMLAYMTWSGSHLQEIDLQSIKKATKLLPNNEPRNEREVFPLSKSIQEQKAIALGCYRSQRIAAGSLLEAGIKNSQEIFVPFS